MFYQTIDERGAMAEQHESKTRFLEAALGLIRAQGFEATTIDEICADANLTKGSFFHHFKSKEELALEAALHWNETTGELFADAPYHALDDPLERLLAYVDLRIDLIAGTPEAFSCLLGTMVQEVYATHPVIRDACARGIGAHAATLERDIEEAKALYVPLAPWSALSLALYTQAVIQGAFVLAKAENSPDVARECLLHLRNYLELAFGRTGEAHDAML